MCNLAALSPQELEAVLAATPVGEVWGVGRRIGAQLSEGRVLTALDLARMDPATVRRRWSVVLEKTVRELRGTPCVALEEVPSQKQQIAITRSFGRPVSELGPLLEAVSEFASRAGEDPALLRWAHPTDPTRTIVQTTRAPWGAQALY